MRRLPVTLAVFAAAALTVGTARADMIPMRDYILLERGMSEGEVLYRVGPYDHQSVSTDFHHNVIRKVWYYIPEHPSSDAWITEIEFDGRGTVQALNRYRARK